AENRGARAARRAKPPQRASGQHCTAAGAAEGGTSLEFTTTAISCPDADGIVTQLPGSSTCQHLYAGARSCTFMGFECRITSPSAVGPGAPLTCTKGSVAIRFALPG